MAFPYRKTLNFNGKELKIDIHSEGDASVYYEIWEQREYSLLEDIIRNSKKPIVDIGAHTGMFSLYASSLNPDVPIFCYEPEPQNFKHLKSNLKINKAFNVFPKNLAVAKKAGNRFLYIMPDSHNHRLLSEEDEDKNANKLAIYTTTLDQIIDKIEDLEDTENCELLKMDCESAEFEILLNTKEKTLRQIKNFYIEYHQYEDAYDLRDLNKVLKNAGFKIDLKISRYDKNLGFVLAKRR